MLDAVKTKQSSSFSPTYLCFRIGNSAPDY